MIWLGLLAVASTQPFQPVLLAANSKTSAKIPSLIAERARNPVGQDNRLQTAVNSLMDGNPSAALTVLDRIIAESPELASAHFYRGLALLELQSPAEAAVALSLATTIAPDAHETWAYLGSARRLAGDPEGALSDLQVAADRLDNNPGLLASVYHERGLAFIAIKDLPEALAALQRAVELAPDRVAIQFDLAVAKLRSGNAADARSRLWRITTKAPDFIEAPLTLALLSYEEGQSEEVLRLLSPVALRAPSRGDVQYVLGIAYRQLERLASAQKSLERALELGHDVPAVRYHLAAVLHPVGELDNAKHHLRQAIAQDPSFSDAYLALGRVEVDLGHLDEALTAMSAASRLSPQSAEALAALGDAQLQVGQVNGAINNLQRALEINPGERSALYALSQALRRRGAKNDEAEARRLLEHHRRLAQEEVDRIENTARAQTFLLQAREALNSGNLVIAGAALQQALSTDPGFMDARILLAFLRAQEGNPGLAVAELQALVKRNPTSADALYYLGRVLALIPDNTAAESAYWGALELENSRPDVRLELGRVLLRSGQPREALEVLEPALTVAPELQPVRDAIEQARDALGLKRGRISGARESAPASSSPRLRRPAR